MYFESQLFRPTIFLAPPSSIIEGNFFFIVESEAFSSLEDWICSQNRDQASILPANGSNLITGSFTDGVAGPIVTVAVG